MSPHENNVLDMQTRQKDRDRAAKGFKFKTLAELAALESVSKRNIIKGIFARGETSGWVAPPGAMKSALMASASIHVGAGLDWFGYRCKERAAVLYFAHERADLVKRRLLAMCDRMEIDFPPIAIVKDHFALGKPGDHRVIVDTIKAAEDCFSLPVGLGIFDTFAKLVAAGGGDENQAMHQGAVFSNFSAIKSVTDIHLAFVGHLGKNVDLGMRGSNYGLGDVDLMVELKANGEIRTAMVTKINDGPEGPLFSFKSEICNLGVDEDGDPITVNIVSGEEVSTSQSERLTREPKLRPNQQTVFAILHGAGSAGLTLEDWNGQAKDAGIGTKRKADLTDIRNALLSKGMVRNYGDKWHVVHESGSGGS